MPPNNKIQQYGLGNRALELHAEGYVHRQIAKILTEELAGKDSVSQATVSRWLLKERRKRKAVAEVILDDYINVSLPADLKILDELTETLLSIFRYNTGGLNKILKLLQANVVDLEAYRSLKIELDAQQSINLPPTDLKVGMQASDRLHQILNTKFRFLGVGDPDEEGTAKVDAKEREELREIARELADKKRKEIHDDNESQEGASG